jgi:inner membrane protein
LAAQQVATQVASESLREQGVQAQRLLVTPAPFNTVLWRLVAITPTHYHEGYYSAAGPSSGRALDIATTGVPS